MIIRSLQVYLEGSKRKGYFEQLKQMCYDFYYNRKFSKYFFKFYDPEVAFNEPDTRPVRDILSKNKDHLRNQPTPYCYIFKGLQIAARQIGEVNLLDVGCGNGRVLVAGASLGFNKVTGVDVDPEAIRMAKENGKRAINIFPNVVFEVLYQDAADLKVPLDANLVFLYNPFGSETLKNVVDSIQQSFKASPRVIRVVYCYPLFYPLFEAKTPFIKIYESKIKNGTPDLLIYQLSPAEGQ